MMQNDDAVSPVVGVIIMVAIVVILASVIVAFFFGLAGTLERDTIQKTITVASICERDKSSETVITTDGETYTFVGLRWDPWESYPQRGDSYKVWINKENDIVKFTLINSCDTHKIGPCTSGCGSP